MGCTDDLPIEADGNAGTAGGHWDEACLDNELMTGWLDSGRPNPVSRITIGGFEDIGYSVDYDVAEEYTLASVNTGFCCFMQMASFIFLSR